MTDKKILFSEEKPILEGFYQTNRGDLWFDFEEGLFCDDDGFPIYSTDKVKWWIKKVNDIN
jgi:hypothetical protein